VPRLRFWPEAAFTLAAPALPKVREPELSNVLPFIVPLIVILLNVGFEVVLISCGVEKVSVLPLGVMMIWLAIPASVMEPYQRLG
jgi:hypothetical protein